MQLASKSKLIEEKARVILKSLYNDYKTGRIKTEIELKYKFYQAIKEFYGSIGKPVFKLRLADEYPISSDYNNMQNELFQDLNIMFIESDGIGTALTEEFKTTNTNRIAMSSILKNLGDRIKSIKIKASELAGTKIFKESFLNNDYFNKSMVDGTPAEINTTANALTLPRLDINEFSDIKIKVLDSNGFPGNTHQVRTSGNTYRFYGEDSLNINMAAMLDNNQDTWFELELIKISEDTLRQADCLGFNYEEGISWITDQELLYVDFELELPEVSDINMINILPFIPPEKGAAAPYLTSLVLDDGKGNYNTVASNTVLNDLAIIVPKQKVKYIRVSLQQLVSYDILIGHFAAFNKTLNNNLAFTGNIISGDRVAGPLSSIKALGFDYDTLNQKALWPEITVDSLLDEVNIKNDLFNIKFDNKLEQVLEALPAKRLFIGIRDFNISCSRFNNSGTYICNPIKVLNPELITLESEQYIPECFGEGNWIEYFVSIDLGKSWIKIDPTDSIKENAVTQIVLNQNLPKELREPGKAYIDTQDNIQEVLLKINLARPELSPELPDADYYSPLVYEYRLRMS